MRGPGQATGVRGAPDALSVLQGRHSGARMEAIGRKYGVPVRTLNRWRQWWRETFPMTRAWRAKRGELAVTPGEAPLRIVLRCIRGRGLRARLLRSLV